MGIMAGQSVCSRDPPLGGIEKTGQSATHVRRDMSKPFLSRRAGTAEAMATQGVAMAMATAKSRMATRSIHRDILRPNTNRYEAMMKNRHIPTRGMATLTVATCLTRPPTGHRGNAMPPNFSIARALPTKRSEMVGAMSMIAVMSPMRTRLSAAMIVNMTLIISPATTVGTILGTRVRTDRAKMPL